MIRKSHNGKIAYCVFILLLYLLLARDAIELRAAPFRYFDELLAVAAIPLALLNVCGADGIRLNRSREGYWKWLMITFSCGLFGNVIYRYQPFVHAALPDMFICLKFWLWIEAGKYLFRHFDLGSYAKGIFRHVRFLTWLYLLLVLIDRAAHIFPSPIRHGIGATQLFYSHPTVFAACMIFLMTLLLLARDGTTRNRFLFYELILSAMACLSLRSKIIGSVLLFWLIVYLAVYRKKKITLWTVLLFIPPVFLIGWNQIRYYFFSDLVAGSARYQLLTKAFRVAADHFPFGAGFATFGSYYSGLHYSPLYSMYGISDVYGITAKDFSFISDSFWPMVLGQTGYFGLLCFAIAVCALFSAVKKTRAGNAVVYASGLFALVYLLVESTSSAAFVHPIYLPIAMILGYVLRDADPARRGRRTEE